MTERARAELEGTVHPSDDTTGREVVSGLSNQAVIVFALLDRFAILGCEPGQLDSVGGGPPERMVGHVAIGIAEMDAIRVQGGPERAACIAGRRRNEDASEARFGEDAGVGDAVERHPASQAHIGQPRLGMERSRHGHERVFEDALHAGRTVREAFSVGAGRDRSVRRDAAAARRGR